MVTTRHATGLEKTLLTSHKLSHDHAVQSSYRILPPSSSLFSVGRVRGRNLTFSTVNVTKKKKTVAPCCLKNPSYTPVGYCFTV